MAGLKHNLEYLGFRIVVFFAQRLSSRTADKFGAILGTWVFYLLGSRRKVAFDNIRATIGQNYSDEQTSALVKKVFQNIGRTLIEFVRFEKLGVEGVRKITSGGNPEMFSKLYENKTGCINITAHYGNWELLAAWVVSIGLPNHIFAATLHNEKINEKVVEFRKALGLGVLPIERNLKHAFKVLKQGEFVAMAVDQHAPNGIKIDFLGRPALAAKGPALFAIRAGCPICPYLIKRESYDCHILIPGELIYPPNSGDEEADIRFMVEEYHKFFEEGIRKYPEQWMWTHKRWKL